MSDLFQDKARDWDKGDLRQRLSSAIAAAMLERVPFDEGMTVMDFGAGTGLLTGRIAPRVASIAAVDVSRAMLDQLSVKRELSGKVDIHHRDILQAPLGLQFDAVISAMALHHIEDTPALLRTLAAHLRPGAWLALADLDTEAGTFHAAGTEGVFHQGFDREALGQQLTDAGFEGVHFSTALSLTKEGRDYSIFLVTAQLPAPGAGDLASGSGQA